MICYQNFLYFAASLFAWTLQLEGRTVSTYLSTDKFTWLEGKENCQMASLEETRNISSSYTGWSWVDVTGTYSTWVEYLGCFDVLEDKLDTSKLFLSGTTLLDCLESCPGCHFIGLQVKRCACLKNISLDGSSVNRECGVKMANKCLNDRQAFCASEDTDIHTHHYAVYQKVSITTQTIGECLSVSRGVPFLRYTALDCLAELFPICLKDRYRNDFYAQRTKKQTWIESFIECSPTFLARHSQIPYDTPLDINGSYWLSNTRRFMTHDSVRKDPEFCMAVQVQQNGKTKQYPSPCKTRLPVLCLGTKVDNRDTTRELLVTVLVITSVLTVVVASMIIVLYMRLRKRGSNAVHVPIDSGKEVIYATVNKPSKSPTNQEQSRKRTPGQSDSDETYDHTDHHRLSQNQSPNESYYDTMQGKGIEDESNYDLTHEPDREKPVVVDDSTEYSHMEDDF
ncbi:uncharacterized protein LOC143083233 [Mytilus galloprovincialis]|uniref:uncharacterized protein LOC143083233 n=1 Tax=Mytilus galloprovincialis TaxID=29158 RepID=UPI003F7C77E8